jgi:hypothetical protein
MNNNSLKWADMCLIAKIAAIVTAPIWIITGIVHYLFDTFLIWSIRRSMNSKK